MLRVATLGATTAVATRSEKVGGRGGKAAGVSLASKVVVVALGVTAVTGAGSVSLRALQARAPSNRTPSPTSAATVTAASPGAGPGSLRRSAAAAATAPARDPAGSAGGGVRSRQGPAPDLAATPRVAAGLPLAPGAADRPRRRRSRPLPPAPPRSGRDTAITEEMTAPVVSAGGKTDAGRDPCRPAAIRSRSCALCAKRGTTCVRAAPQAPTVASTNSPARTGGGMLAQERSALSAIALCQWQPGPEAQARAAEFLRSSPESPLATRVRSACARLPRPPVTSERGQVHRAGELSGASCRGRAASLVRGVHRRSRGHRRADVPSPTRRSA